MDPGNQTLVLSESGKVLLTPEPSRQVPNPRVSPAVSGADVLGSSKFLLF